jgi:hypothetical protein
MQLGGGAGDLIESLQSLGALRGAMGACLWGKGFRFYLNIGGLLELSEFGRGVCAVSGIVPHSGQRLGVARRSKPQTRHKPAVRMCRMSRKPRVVRSSILHDMNAKAAQHPNAKTHIKPPRTSFPKNNTSNDIIIESNAMGPTISHVPTMKTGRCDSNRFSRTRRDRLSRNTQTGRIVVQRNACQ